MSGLLLVKCSKGYIWWYGLGC